MIVTVFQKVLLMDTRIWILYNFHEYFMKYYSFYFFTQHLKNTKTILNSKIGNRSWFASSWARMQGLGFKVHTGKGDMTLVPSKTELILWVKLSMWKVYPLSERMARRILPIFFSICYTFSRYKEILKSSMRNWNPSPAPCRLILPILNWGFLKPNHTKLVLKQRNPRCILQKFIQWLCRNISTAQGKRTSTEKSLIWWDHNLKTVSKSWKDFFSFEGRPTEWVISILRIKSEINCGLSVLKI